MKQILIVDDSDDQRLLAMLAMERVAPGLPVCAYSSGEACLDAIASGSVEPLLLLLDLHMPRMDGASAAAKIRGLPGIGPTVRIIMMSSTDSISEVRRGYAAGVSSFVRKPSGSWGWPQLLGAVVPYWLYIDRASAT